MKIGTSRFAGAASAASVSAIGKEHESAMTPASRSGWRRPV
jgi:hypothetical protein